MPAEVFEGSMELTVDVLEQEPAEDGACGPFGRLRRTGTSLTRSFHTLVLENQLIRAEILTELGGRIGRLTDKRTGAAVLDISDRARVALGGPRGVEVPEGICLTLDGSRPNELGTVQWLADPAGESSAGCWIAECSCGPIAMHLHLGLSEGEAELHLEARLFNRSHEATHYNGGFRIGGPFKYLSGQGATACWNATSQAGLLAWSDELVSRESDGEVLYVSRFDRLRTLAPGQLDTWSATLMPLSGLGCLTACCRGIAAHLGDGALEILVSRDRPARRVFLMTGSGQTLEASTDLIASKPASLELSTVGNIAGFAIMSPDRKEEIRFEPLGMGSIGGFNHAEPEQHQWYPDASQTLDELERAGFHWPWRAISEELIGKKLLRMGDFDGARRRFEQALLYNAENHLVWWLKAACSRLEGKQEPESPDQLNAHYLAPLEPCLRAEAFLQQTNALGSEPNPLLRGMEETPLDFLEVACQLVEAGLFADATRWIDEAIRHVDMPMLRYLQAYCLLAGSRLDMEAALQLTQAAKLGFVPPYPYRRIEAEALKVLLDRFGSDTLLKRYGQLT
jgi:tetratricopeptide (TPR) repeat protein